MGTDWQTAAAGFPVSGVLVQQAQAADAGISWGKAPVAFVEPICRSSVAIVGLVSGPVFVPEVLTPSLVQQAEHIPPGMQPWLIASSVMFMKVARRQFLKPMT